MHALRSLGLILIAATGAAGQSQVLIGNLGAAAGPGTVIGPGTGVQRKAAGWTITAPYQQVMTHLTLSLDYAGAGLGRFTLWEGAGSPQAELVVFSALQAGSGDIVFYPVQSVTLQPTTTYWVVAEPDVNSLGTFEWLGTQPPVLPTGGTAANAGYQLNGQPDWIYNRFAAHYFCYPNCDNSTTPPTLNVADFTCFLQKFAAGEWYANCDGYPNYCNPPPCLNVADFTCFLVKFAAGCP